LGGVGSDGGTPPAPSDPADDSDPLPNSWSFSISPEQIHMTQSLENLGNYLRDGGAAPDFGGKIGVDRDQKVVGVDVPPQAASKFTRTWARPNVTLGYFRLLFALAGCTNSAPIFGFAVGEVALLGASGQGTEGDKWSMSAEFGVRFNETIAADGICSGLPAVDVDVTGWSYKWILDSEVKDGNNVVVQPRALYIERVLREADLNTIFEL
jgi:hypothetical protein